MCLCILKNDTHNIIYYIRSFPRFVLLFSMDIPVDQLATLASVFGGVIQTYYDTYIKDHPGSVTISIPADCKMLVELVGKLSRKEALDEKIARYSSSPVLDVGVTFSETDFDNACANGHLNYARWLEYKPTNRTIRMVIENDQSEVLSWCIAVNPSLVVSKEEIYKHDAIKCSTLMGLLDPADFDSMCRMGALEIAKRVCSEHTIDVTDYVNVWDPFVCACASGVLPLVELTYSLVPDNLRSGDVDDLLKEATEAAAENGHLHIIKFLEVKYEDSVIEICNYAIEEACHNGHLHIVQHVVEYDLDMGVDFSYCESLPFRLACHGGHPATALYILNNSSEKIDIYACGGAALKSACHYSNRALASVLLALGNRWPTDTILDAIAIFGRDIVPWRHNFTLS